MGDFNLNLSEAEEHLDENVEGDVVLGVLDGSTDPEVWIRTVEANNVLVLSVEGDLNELAKGFARPVRDMGGSLTHFRNFLIAAPPEVDIDTDRL